MFSPNIGIEKRNEYEMAILRSKGLITQNPTKETFCIVCDKPTFKVCGDLF